MALFNRFNLFTDDLVKGVLNFDSDIFKIMLTHSSPFATMHVYRDIEKYEITEGYGYKTGGEVTEISLTNADGVEVITAASVTWNANGGSIGPFRYAVIYNTTPIIKTLVCWFDYNSSILLNKGESFTVEPNAATPSGKLFTLG